MQDSSISSWKDWNYEEEESLIFAGPCKRHQILDIYVLLLATMQEEAEQPDVGIWNESFYLLKIWNLIT